jgi:hypothetical protein
MRHAAVSLALFLSFNAASANGDLCRSEAFRAAFLEGQGVVEDEPTVGQQIVSFGDPMVPCLRAIALQGEETLGIRCQVQELPGGCRTWAVLGLGTLRSPAAQTALLEVANLAPATPVAVAAVRALALAASPEARGGLRALLQHQDADVRTEALVALAHFGESCDHAAMVEMAIELPDAQFRTAAIILARKVDLTHLAALKQRADRIQDAGLRVSVNKALQRRQE